MHNLTSHSVEVDMDTPRSQYNFTGNYEQAWGVYAVILS